MSLEKIKSPKCQGTTFLTKKGRIMKHGLCDAAGDYLNQWKTSNDSGLAMATLDWKLAVDGLYAAFAEARDAKNDIGLDEQCYHSTPAIDEASRECSRTYKIMADLREQLGLCRDPQDQRARM